MDAFFEIATTADGARADLFTQTSVAVTDGVVDIGGGFGFGPNPSFFELGAVGFIIFLTIVIVIARTGVVPNLSAIGFAHVGGDVGVIDDIVTFALLIGNARSLASESLGTSGIDGDTAGGMAARGTRIDVAELGTSETVAIIGGSVAIARRCFGDAGATLLPSFAGGIGLR